jgi:hypothetical protein
VLRGNPLNLIRFVPAKGWILLKHLLPFLFSNVLAAQTLTGYLTSADGGALANGVVTATHLATGQQRTAPASATGLYVLPGLLTGRHKLEAARRGHQTVAVELDLAIQQTRQVDLQLTATPTTELRVVAAPPALETTNATLSGLVDGRRVLELPLNGRNFAQLINLQPGVALISSHGLLGGGPDSSGIQGSGLFVNGARGGHNNFLFDGADANDPVVPSGTGAASTAVFTGGAPGINGISADAVAEFRVITSNAPAEFGRSSGAVINVVTKSGGNALHGSLFEYLRNRALNARNTFEARKPGFTQNNFGGTLGGAVRRDRTFYFASYEGFRQRQSVTVPVNAPSPNTIAAMKRQNALLGGLAEAYFAPAQTQVNDRPVEEILAANQPVIATSFRPRPNGIDQNALLGRLDERLPRDGWLTLRYAWFGGEGIPGTISGQGLPGSNVGYTNASQNAVLVHTQPLSPRTLHEARLSVQRNTPRATFEETPAALLAVGRLRVSNTPYGAPDSANGIPTVNLGFGLTPIGYETTAPNRRGVTTYQLGNALTAIRGAHTWKAGGEFRRIQENSVFSFRLRPDVVFNSAGANTIFRPGAPVQSYDQNVFVNPGTSQRGFRLSEWAGFVQDTWRVSRRLTLDLGLRYEFFGRPYEVNGYLNNGFLTGANGEALASADQLSAPINRLRLFPVGRGRVHDFYQPDRNNFAPRVGVAWAQGAHAVRLGYGIFYDRLFNNVFGNARVSPPYTVPVFITGEPFGATPPVDPFTTTLGISPVTVNPTFRNAYTQRFNATYQRELFGQTMVEAGYVGARALRLVRTLRLNQGAAFPLAFRPANVDAPARTNSLDSFRPLNLANMSTRDSSGASTYHSFQLSAKRRFAGRYGWQLSYTLGQSTDIASGEILTDLVITSITNTLPLRTADGLVPLPSLDLLRGLEPGLANVTDAARYYNQRFLGPNQWRAEIGNSAFDIRQTLVANGSLALKWGVQLNAIYRWQSGVPFVISTGLDANGDGNAPDRAALLGGSLSNLIAPQGRQFFAPSTLGRGRNNQLVRTFNGATVGVSETPENVASYLKRGALHGPSLALLDFSLHKTFTLRENLRLQARAECFNLPNATNYGLPAATLTSPQFGLMTFTSTPPRQIQFALRLEF